MRCYPDCRFSCQDVSAGGGLPGQYDVALCSEVLQHIPDYASFAQTVFDSLTPGGRAVFTVPNLSPSAEHVSASISSQMSAEELLAEVGGAGFGRQHAVWKFNSDRLYEELASGGRVVLDEKRPVDTPDGQRQNLWTVGVFRRD